MLSSNIDIKGMLDWLVSQKVLTGNEFFNRLGMGAEVRQGVGSLTINNFQVDYSAKSAAARSAVVVNHVPLIDSNRGRSTAALTLATSTKAVATVHATDADGSAPTYTITSDADAMLFTRDVKTGALAFKAAPSYAAPKDAGGDNVTVQAIDDSVTDSQDLSVSVSNAGSSAVFRGGAASTQTLTMTSNHCNSAWALTRTTETDVLRFDGTKKTVEALDATGKIKGYTITINAYGREMVQHFDVKWAFDGAEQTTHGVQTVTTHFDAVWQEAGHDLFYMQNGRAIEQHLDANWKFESADAVTPAATQAVNHDVLNDWVMALRERCLRRVPRLRPAHGQARRRRPRLILQRSTSPCRVRRSNARGSGLHDPSGRPILTDEDQIPLLHRFDSPARGRSRAGRIPVSRG